MFHFPVFSPSHLMVVNAIHIEGVIFIVTSCRPANQLSKCPLVSMNLPELMVCLILFFWLLEEAMAAVFKDEFWSNF